MQYGICHLSIVPVRIGPNDTAEMVTQLLYGCLFKVKELRKHWIRIEIAYDGQEGWISKKQYISIAQEDYNLLDAEKDTVISTDFISHIITQDNIFQPITIGSRVDILKFLGHSHEGSSNKPSKEKTNLVETALLFLNAPYLWGGKTPLE